MEGDHITPPPSKTIAISKTNLGSVEVVRYVHVPIQRSIKYTVCLIANKAKYLFFIFYFEYISLLKTSSANINIMTNFRQIIILYLPCRVSTNPREQGIIRTEYST